MKNGQTILEGTYFRGFEYCRTFVLSGSSFSFGKIPVFDRWMLKNEKIKFLSQCREPQSHTDTPTTPQALPSTCDCWLPSCGANPCQYGSKVVIGIVLSDFVFYCDHFPEIWDPRSFFSIEIQWFNMMMMSHTEPVIGLQCRSYKLYSKMRPFFLENSL